MSFILIFINTWIFFKLFTKMIIWIILPLQWPIYVCHTNVENFIEWLKNYSNEELEAKKMVEYCKRQKSIEKNPIQSTKDWNVLIMGQYC